VSTQKGKKKGKKLANLDNIVEDGVSVGHCAQGVVHGARDQIKDGLHVCCHLRCSRLASCVAGFNAARGHLGQQETIIDRCGQHSLREQQVGQSSQELRRRAQLLFVMRSREDKRRD